jgi:tripartite-type tricarboxylate transporter receptor subunit TctC
MKLPRRTFLHLAAGAVAVPAVSRVSWAQTYPSRSVRIVVGFAPGGPNDINARLVGQWLSERLGQQFIVDNRPGASGNIAMESVVKSPSDGYPLVMVATSSAANATLYDNLAFNFLRDIAPVGGISRTYYVMLVHPSVQAKTGAELLALAKANPGKLNMASPGSGTGAHMASELFKIMTGISMVHVPYRGSGPMLAGLLGGQVQFAFDTIFSSIEHIRSGGLRALVYRRLRVPSFCRTSRPLPSSCLGTRPAPGSVSAHLRTHPLQLLTSSTRRSMRGLLIPR